MRIRKDRARGFTLIELLVVMAILLVISAMAIPYFINIVRDYRLRVNVINAMGMVQETRMRSVRDARFYSGYYLGASPNLRYYVDVFPQQPNGVSGNGGAGTACDAPPPGGSGKCDPVMGFASDILARPAGAAPNTGQLRNLFLQGSAVVPYDGFDPTNPVSFSAEGIPCLPMGTAQGVAGGSICNSRSNWKAALPSTPVAYWLFYQHQISGNWQAVTVTPAGRIQRWTYYGTSWGAAG